APGREGRRPRARAVVAAPHHGRRPGPARALPRGRDRGGRSAHGRPPLEPPAQDGLRAQHQPARVGRRKPALRLVGLQRGQPRARAAPGRGKTTVSALWAGNRMRIHIGNAMRIGDYVYGSSGDFGPAPFTAINVRTGEVAWRDRAFGRATSVYADGKLIVLDEDGTLALATVSPEGLKVLAKASVFHGRSWTAPTLVGTRLFLRDRATIKALDLGVAP